MAVDLTALNPPQQQAVMHESGPLVVFAGAGSGKTRVITHRIAQLIANQGIPPWHILAVTFTNKAALEMRHRVAQLLHEPEERLWIGTFHAICAKLLRLYSPHTEVFRNFVIYDDADQRTLITRVLRDLQLDERRFVPRQMAAQINQAKQEMIGPEQYQAGDYYTDAVLKVYTRYEEHLTRARALDFGDLIYRCVLALENNSQLRSELQRRFLHVLVDEFQDTNRAQFRFVQALASGHRNVCVVGDDDQSIYRWRGADRRNILDFSRVFDDARVVKLEQNYRSTQRILRAADAVISRCLDREPKTLWTENDEGAEIALIRCMDERDEARVLIQGIRQLQNQGRGLSDIAVFYRIHAQSRVIEEGLRAANIPYVIVGGMRFYERAEIKDMLAFLRVISNPNDDVSLLRIVNIPPRGIGKTSIEHLLDFATQHKLPLWDVLARLGDIDTLTSLARRKLADFRQLITELLELHQKDPSPLRLANEIVERTGYTKRLREEDNAEADARLQNIQEFLGSMLDFEQDAEHPTLDAFLELVTLQTSDNKTDAPSQLTLMTVHAAKGLEFPVVMVAGMEEGLFPYKGIDPADDSEALEEERRLAYVAFTRAREQLWLTYAVARRVFGQTRAGLLSRFVEEVPSQDLHVSGSATLKSASKGWMDFQRPRSSGARNESYVDRSEGDLGDNEQWRGSMVQHAKFGVGRVINMTQGSPPTVTVVFPGWGQKKIASTYLQPV
ncbi:MAG: UvrD-helicase domain-containing protein [Myxococcales bacterium]|nr:UvrD-helicase domain-containing protein [Myxococcales bacterium]MCB9707361.1 UvrD-helicase domain-containing protein [Myxococcales bacterium]